MRAGGGGELARGEEHRGALGERQAGGGEAGHQAALSPKPPTIVAAETVASRLLPFNPCKASSLRTERGAKYQGGGAGTPRIGTA